MFLDRLPVTPCVIPSSAMILAAGLGKRMLPLTERIPKPMLVISGSTILDRAIEHLSPLKHIDKRFILQCYKEFNIESLLQLTNSCIYPEGNCSECWWCQERNWALNETLR